MNNAPITPKPARKGRKFLGWSVTVVAAMIIGGALLGDDETPAPETVTADVERPEAKPEPKAKEPAPEPAEPETTVSQDQAVASAESYLAVMAFSRTGLIEQLAYDGFSKDDATYAVDTIAVDWNEQAAASAQAYLDVMAFSGPGLAEQLRYDGFTAKQTAYGVESVGL
jgi:hypothetical protein